ncbi:hypothetical protein BsWGS_27433 [Bradybaena similaris]
MKSHESRKNIICGSSVSECLHVMLCLVLVHIRDVVCPVLVHIRDVLCPVLVHIRDVLCPVLVHIRDVLCPVLVHIRDVLCQTWVNSEWMIPCDVVFSAGLWSHRRCFIAEPVLLLISCSVHPGPAVFGKLFSVDF